jgi:hypothetical protein
MATLGLERWSKASPNLEDGLESHNVIMSFCKSLDLLKELED